MSEAKYPLCARAGLKVFVNWHHMDAIHAADVEKLLEGALKVYRNSVSNWSTIYDEKFDTETARLIMIEPIVKDTAESLLRELLRVLDGRFDSPSLNGVTDRARRLLEAK